VFLQCCTPVENPNAPMPNRSGLFFENLLRLRNGSLLLRLGQAEPFA